MTYSNSSLYQGIKMEHYNLIAFLHFIGFNKIVPIFDRFIPAFDRFIIVSIPVTEIQHLPRKYAFNNKIFAYFIFHAFFVLFYSK